MTKPMTTAEAGRLGGKKAAQNMTPEQRKERARKAGQGNKRKVHQHNSFGLGSGCSCE